MTLRRCLDCRDGRHCRHTGDVPAGMLLAACRRLDCDPQPIQARLFSHAQVVLDLGDCARPACRRRSAGLAARLQFVRSARVPPLLGRAGRSRGP
jgi:hypothetical protein